MYPRRDTYPNIPMESKFEYLTQLSNKSNQLVQSNFPSASEKLIQEMMSGLYKTDMDMENNQIINQISDKKRIYSIYQKSNMEDRGIDEKIQPIKKTVEIESSFGKINNITKKK